MNELAAVIAAVSMILDLTLSLNVDAPGGPSIVLAMCGCADISLLAAGCKAG